MLNKKLEKIMQKSINLLSKGNIIETPMKK